MVDWQWIVGQNVKRLREERQYAIMTLAKITNLHRGTLSKLEEGEGNVTLTILAIIAEGLKVPPAALWEAPKMPARRPQRVAQAPGITRRAAPMNADVLLFEQQRRRRR